MIDEYVKKRANEAGLLKKILEHFEKWRCDISTSRHFEIQCSAGGGRRFEVS